MKNKHIAAINPSNLSREELIISKCVINTTVTNNCFTVT